MEDLEHLELSVDIPPEHHDRVLHLLQQVRDVLQSACGGQNATVTPSTLTPAQQHRPQQMKQQQSAQRQQQECLEPDHLVPVGKGPAW